jgi:hypothetical protein
MVPITPDENEDVRYEIEDCVNRVQRDLDQGFDSVDACVVAQSLIERCVVDAKRIGFSDELDRLRRMHDEVDRRIYLHLLYDLVDELHHGDRPPEPEYEWKWNDYAHTIAEGRARGLDVRRAEEAVASAREVAAEWARDAAESGKAPAAGKQARRVGSTAEARPVRPQVTAPDPGRPAKTTPAPILGSQPGAPAAHPHRSPEPL